MLFVRKNAMQVLIPKYGLECTLYLNKKDEKSIFEYNEENHTQTCGDIVFHAFDPVTVRLSLDSKNIQHEKFVLQLVKPFIPGFSVAPLSEVEKVELKRKNKTDDADKNKKSKIKGK